MLRDLHIDRLKTESEVLFAESLTPEEIDLPSESALRFREPIWIEGKVTLVGEHLCFFFAKIDTVAELTCSICNQWCELPLQLRGIHYPLEELMKESRFDTTPLLRELLLLELPYTIECYREGCPERQELQKYLKKENSHGSPT